MGDKQTDRQAAALDFVLAPSQQITLTPSGALYSISFAHKASPPPLSMQSPTTLLKRCVEMPLSRSNTFEDDLRN